MPKQIAQVNVATPRMSREDEGMAFIVDNIAAVFDLAERSKGFVWRLDNYEGELEDRANSFGDPNLFINISVWQSLGDFKAFAFDTVHRKFLTRRDEWFFPSETPVTALWWIDEGHTPTLDEAHMKLQQLRRDGPGPDVFSLDTAFDESGTRVGSLLTGP